MSYLLGSFIPDRVSADIVSFLTDQEICQFNLASPRAHAIVNYYKLLKNDFQSMRFEFDKCFEEGKLTMSATTRTFEFSSRNVETTTKTESKKIITAMLSKCRETNSICFTRLTMDTSYMKLMLKFPTNFVKLMFTKVNVSPDLFLDFIQKYPRAVQLRGVEMSNQLISKESLLLLSEIKIYRSWEADCQKFENRVVNVTDDTLKEILKSKELSKDLFESLPSLELCGFITGFTVEGIDLYGQDSSEFCDFGIIGCDHLTEAFNFSTGNDVSVDSVKLQSWNGQKTIVYTVRYDDAMTYSTMDHFETIIRFAVSLNETVQGPVSDASLPVPGVSTEALHSFDKLVKFLHTAETFDTANEEKYDMHSVEISFETSQLPTSKFKIVINDEKFEKTAVLVKTDISLKEAYQLIVRLFKMCTSIGEIQWGGLYMYEEFYDMLKSVADGIDITSPWTIHIPENCKCLLEILKERKQLFRNFFICEITFKSVVLSNEVLAIYLGKKFQFDHTLILKSDGSGGYSNPLNDDFLLILSGKVKDLPNWFSLMIYTSMFTGEGIKSFMEALATQYSTSIYYLGRIDESNQGDVKKMIAELEADKSGLWEIKKEETKHICSVTIEKIKLVDSYRKQRTETVFTISFDIVNNKH